MAKKKKTLKEKRAKQLWYKLSLTKDKYPKPIYFILEFFALIWEMIKGILRFISEIVLVCVIFFIVTLFVGYLFIRPTVKEYNSCAKEFVNNSNYYTFMSIADKDITDYEVKLHKSTDNYLIYEDIPSEIINAYIAVEDRNYWNNWGIDIKGITRVVVDAIKSKGEELHGASTITQQLARNVFLSHTVSIERKAKEMMIALRLNRKYSKEDILEFYCNDICYANGIYGIENASQFYFGKTVKELSLRQMTYLCAIPNSPENYNPLKNYKKAIVRSEKILGDMLEQGYITEEEYNKAMTEQIKIVQK